MKKAVLVTIFTLFSSSTIFAVELYREDGNQLEGVQALAGTVNTGCTNCDHLVDINEDTVAKTTETSKEDSEGLSQ